MAPPTVQDEADDFSDLDDVLDQFSPSSSKPQPPVVTAAVPPKPSSSRTPAPPPSSAALSATDDFPDPDDEPLPTFDDPQLTKDLEEGMKALFAGLNPSADARAGGKGEEIDEGEFRKVMEELMRGDLGGLAGAAGEGTDDEQLRGLMASLGLGGAASSTGTPSLNTKGKAREAPRSSSSSPAAPPAPPASFQDVIAASMSKMRDSSTTADAAAESSRTAGQGGDAGMATMLAQLAGMPDLGNMDGSDEGMQGMLDEMMQQLMSRDMLYDPLKELSDKYPAYLAEHASSLPPGDLERYNKQNDIVCAIVEKFEEPGADAQPPYSPEEEENRSKRTEAVVELVAKMNECGAPPPEIMGEMPPGMELGPDGVPKVPDCVVS
ncbi:hypothetical protein JCM11641_004910 [Rhodosporidiobolus odoratus]